MIYKSKLELKLKNYMEVNLMKTSNFVP